MKEIDDTPTPKSETEQMFEHVSAAVDKLNELLSAKIVELELRISELEVQRVANENNQDDPEWH